jgi:hypothetical protein
MQHADLPQSNHTARHRIPNQTKTKHSFVLFTMNGRNGPFALQKVSTLSLFVTLLHLTLYLLFCSPSHPSAMVPVETVLLKAFAGTINAAPTRE